MSRQEKNRNYHVRTDDDRATIGMRELSCTIKISVLHVYKDRQELEFLKTLSLKSQLL